MEEILQLVIFLLGEQEYGIDIINVDEIDRCKNIGNPTIEIRGNIFPVVDLRKQFGLRPTFNDQTRLLVLNLAGVRMSAAVDAVSEIIRVPQMASFIMSDNKLVREVVMFENRKINILDAHNLFADFIAQSA